MRQWNNRMAEKVCHIGRDERGGNDTRADADRHVLDAGDRETGKGRVWEGHVNMPLTLLGDSLPVSS